MLYASARSGIMITVTDSETGNKFHVTNQPETVKYFRGDDLFDMSTVLGYIRDDICVVPSEIVTLLDYVKYVIRLTSQDLDTIVSWGRVLYTDVNNVIVMTGTYRYYNILDMIMCASYRDDFNDILSRGKLTASFNYQDSFEVYFCGDYKGYLVKLVTLYRRRWEGLNMLSHRDSLGYMYLKA